MNVPDMLKLIGDQIQSGATWKNVYGEPVSVAERAVIPVARVRYGFGGGGGSQTGELQAATGGGGGGGGSASAIPVGVIEITPTGTSFIPIHDWRKTLALGLICLGIGIVFGARWTR